MKGKIAFGDMIGRYTRRRLDQQRIGSPIVVAAVMAMKHSD